MVIMINILWTLLSDKLANAWQYGNAFMHALRTRLFLLILFLCL